MSTNTAPANVQPLHGGNVYFPTEADAFEHDPTAMQELLAIGGMFGVTLVAGLTGVCMVMGYGWAHLVALLTP